MVDLYIKFIFALLSTFAIVILNFVIFKIPIKGNDKQIVIIAIVLGSTNFYLKFIVASDNFLIIQILVYVAIMTIVRKYPVLYSAAVCIIGAISISIIDAIITFIAIKLNLTTIDQTTSNLIDYILLHTVVTAVYLLLAWILVKKSIGFSFVRRKFSGRYSLSSATFIWAGLLIIGVIVLQVSSHNYVFFSVNSFMMILATAILLTSVIYAFFQNKKSIRERYGENKKGE
jgi:hypothetical protein